MSQNEVKINTLSNTSFEIQDNTFADKWGIVLDPENLPAELKSTTGYSIKIGEQSYELTVNKFNNKVYNVQVSSLEHSFEEVQAGTLIVK